MRCVISSEQPRYNLLQCCRLPDRSPRDFAMHNYLHLYVVFQSACLFCGLFLAEHLTELCGSQVGLMGEWMDGWMFTVNCWVVLINHVDYIR